MTQGIERARARIRAAMEQAVDSGEEIGLQVALYVQGREIADEAVGMADVEQGVAATPDSLFNVFSVAKGITITALHLQAERGLVEYEAPVATYWPEFAANGKSGITVRHVLTHSSGVPQMPEGTTIAQMCDWAQMVTRIADLRPIAAPGTQATYQALNHGWLVGEIVRRTDPVAGRSFGRFVREELGNPLGAPDLWIGVPPAEEDRVARLYDALPHEERSGLHAEAMPNTLSLIPANFDRPDVRRAEIASVGGVFTARSCARLWAMLANGGELDGVRLLSTDRVAGFSQPRSLAGQPDAVLMGYPVPISEAGYWLGGPSGSPDALYHPGAGNSIAWADPRTGVAAAICHNRMYLPTPTSNPLVPVFMAIHEAVALAGAPA